jgi:ribosomal protein L7/L12
MLANVDPSLMAILAILAISCLIVLMRRPNSTEFRVRRVERKIDLICKHLGIEYPEPASAAGLSAEVRQLANDPAQKISAIKLHRQQTGIGLKEAKDAVEAYIRESTD